MTRVTWKKKALLFLFVVIFLICSGLLPRYHSRAWLPDVPLPYNKSCGCRWGTSPSSVFPPSTQEPPGVPEDRAGMPSPRGFPLPCDSVPWHSPRAYRVSLPLEFPLPHFFLSDFPLSCSHRFLRELPSPQGPFRAITLPAS